MVFSIALAMVKASKLLGKYAEYQQFDTIRGFAHRLLKHMRFPAGLTHKDACSEVIEEQCSILLLAPHNQWCLRSLLVNYCLEWAKR